MLLFENTIPELYKKQKKLYKYQQYIELYNQSMAQGQKQQQSTSLAIWKVKLELAAEGSYQAIQQIKQHVLDSTDDSHPIFKHSLYDILQQGYQLKQISPTNEYPRSFEMYKNFPLFFLISGSVSVKCINLEGDTQTILSVPQKGLVSILKTQLQKKFGQTNINLLTKFQLEASQPSIILQIMGSNKLNQKLEQNQISQKQSNIMNRFMILPSKEVVRVTVNSTNQQHIKDKIYLLDGKACYYLDDEKQFGKKLILTCYQEGYLNPQQFEQPLKDTNTVTTPNSINILPNKDIIKCSNFSKKLNIKFYIFEQSHIMYLQQNFLKDDLIKAIQIKRYEHLKQIIDRYRNIGSNKQAVEAAQNRLIMRFKLNKKQVNSSIYKIRLQPKISKRLLLNKQQLQQKRTKSSNDFISTTSNIKCSIRIRKPKRLV